MTENNKNSVLTIEAENGIIDNVATMSINSSDAYPNTSATAVALGLNDWGAGYFCCPDDAVWFKFTPSTTKYYTIRSDGSLDVMAQLYNSSNVLLNQADDEGPGMNFRMVAQLTAGQTYYIKVTAFGTVGAFNIIVSDFVYVESVTIDQEEITINRGNSYNLSTTILPDGATNKNLYWQSGNTNVATVDSNGKVTAVGGGETCICAYSQDGSNKYSCCVVRVKIPVAYVTVSEPTKTMYVGQSDYVKATAFPGNASNRTLRWSSSNSNIASVDPITGYVTAKSVGTVYIYATAQDGTGEQGVCTITVESPIPVQGLQLGWESFSLDVGETEVIDYAVLPANATNKAVTWCSSNPNVVEINASTGLMTAKKAGTAVITGVTMDGSFSAYCTVTVCKLKIYQTKNTFMFDENGNLAEDLKCNDIPTSDFNDIGNIDWSNYDFEDTDELRNNWERLCRLTATQPLQNVVLDMVDHFMEGTGDNYSNDALTAEVVNHASTEEYIEAVKTKLNDVLSTYNGDISTFKYNVEERENNPFIKKLKGTNQPAFDEPSDYVNGLVICLHGIWGNQIEVKSYVKSGNTYSGTLTFTLYDHFGLDEVDVVKFEKWHEGFGAWYILQHSQSFSGEYKPFVTVMEFDVDFFGTI